VIPNSIEGTRMSKTNRKKSFYARPDESLTEMTEGELRKFAEDIYDRFIATSAKVGKSDEK